MTHESRISNKLESNTLVKGSTDTQNTLAKASVKTFEYKQISS